MSFRIFIHANNVHQGGGLFLLQSLLEAISERLDWYATLDSRLATLIQIRNLNRIRWVSATIIMRLLSEIWLVRKVDIGNILLCFGNLPPIFRSRGKVIVFLQNRYLVDSVDLTGFPLLVQFRIRLERLWLKFCHKNVDVFIVQTITMQRLLNELTSGSVRSIILPFIGSSQKCNFSGDLINKLDQGGNDFLYVASGEPHKNHLNLIEAWCLLAEAGKFPSLTLTIDPYYFPDLCCWIAQRTAQYNLNVKNLGKVSPGEIYLLYTRVRALIYPSKLESFGLPLIEAMRFNLPVLAPELDYIRDILDPVQTFDPNSPISIVRAVYRFLNISEIREPIQDEADFLKAVISIVNFEIESL